MCKDNKKQQLYTLEETVGLKLRPKRKLDGAYSVP